MYISCMHARKAKDTNSTLVIDEQMKLHEKEKKEKPFLFNTRIEGCAQRMCELKAEKL
jgi:hypothetical protein